jgi:hypothetical protein
MQPIKGTAEECLMHYLSNTNGEDYAKIIAYVGIANKAPLKRWENGLLPNGGNLVKVRYFLDEQNYHVTELRSLQHEVRELGHVYATNKLTITELADILGYTTKSKEQHATGLLLGRHKLPPQKLAQVAGVLARFPKQKQQAKEEPRNRMPVAVVIEHEAQAHPVGVKLMLSMAAQNIHSLTVVAEHLASPASSEAERALLHSLAGDNAVLKLISSLRPLCSETALRLHTQHNRGKK